MKGGNKKLARTANPRSRALAISIGAFVIVILIGVTQGLTVQEIGFGPLKVHLGRTAKGEPLPVPSSSPLSFGNCTLAQGAPGTVQPEPARADELVFCPVQLNGGSLPITSRYFEIRGQVLGPVGRRKTLALVVYGDPQTCDVLGNHPPTGGFLAEDFNPISPTGVWSYIDDSGYDEAISIGRTYKYLDVPESGLDAMKRDPANWNAAHPGQEREYPGILDLPNGVNVLSDFYVAGNPTVKRKKPCGTQ
jgi:hypothetical protein